MGFSNLVALAIIITAAATLHAKGITDVQTSSDAAKALGPVAGRFAFILFSLGIVATGLLAIQVPAGSAAYALGESRRWPTGLDRQPLEARAFYVTLAAATLIGAALSAFSVDPIRELFWSAVINGVSAPPVMVLMMLMTRRSDVIGSVPDQGHSMAAGLDRDRRDVGGGGIACRIERLVYLKARARGQRNGPVSLQTSRGTAISRGAGKSDKRRRWQRSAMPGSRHRPDQFPQKQAGSRAQPCRRTGPSAKVRSTLSAPRLCNSMTILGTSSALSSTVRLLRSALLFD